VPLAYRCMPASIADAMAASSAKRTDQSFGNCARASSIKFMVFPVKGTAVSIAGLAAAPGTVPGAAGSFACAFESGDAERIRIVHALHGEDRVPHPVKPDVPVVQALLQLLVGHDQLIELAGLGRRIPAERGHEYGGRRRAGDKPGQGQFEVNNTRWGWGGHVSLSVDVKKPT